MKLTRGRKKSQEDKNFDKIAGHLFGGRITDARSEFRSQMFQEWMTLHPNIVEEALAPPASKEKDILEIIVRVLIEKQEISLKDLLHIIKPKTTLTTQTALKPYILKLVFPSTYQFIYPKRLKGASVLKLKLTEIPQDQFLFQLRQAYETAPSKMGDMIEIPILAEILKKNTGWEIDHIYQQLFQAYLEKRVDLQPGKASSGKPLEAEDGSTFYWFQFR